MRRRALAVLALLPLLGAVPRPAPPSTSFGRLVDRLSESGGFFQSDNLVSNETSYLHALDSFRALGLSGGAYLGVGPETGFSYIAELKPSIAFVIDIRRDNLLLHLLFKAMFETARNRLEYLCLLYGRPAPRDLAMWTELPLRSLLDYIDGTRVDSSAHERNHRALLGRLSKFGVPLTADDSATLRRFHDEFAYTGLEMRYTNRGRPSRLMFPSARDLYLETDLEGNEASYLATEDRWRAVRGLQRRDLVVPVVGDLSGPKAVRAIGDYLRETGRTLSVFYLSNVESYLFRQGSFGAFVGNVRALPITPKSVLVRSWFGRGYMLPTSVPGHFSTQLTQTVSRFLEITTEPDSVSYWSLLNDTALVRPPAAAARPTPP